MGRKRLNLVLPLSELLIFAGTPKNHKGSALSLQMAGQHPGPGIAGRQGWIQPEGWQTRSRNRQSSRSSREHNCVHFSLAGSWFITLTLAMQVAAAVRTGGVCKGKCFHQDMTGDGVASLGPNLVQVPLAWGASYPILPAALGCCQQCRWSCSQGWHSQWHEYFVVKADVTCTISTFPRYLYVTWALSMRRCRALMWLCSAQAEPNPDLAGSISCR